jgi:heme-degrading monooxygenase HmoA
MVTRNVTIKLQANSASEFTRLIEKEIIPLLHEQSGFLNAITLVAPQGLEAMAISLWDTQEQAEAYDLSGYPEVVKLLSKVIEGIPKVGTFVVATSTFSRSAAKGAGSTLIF